MPRRFASLRHRLLRAGVAPRQVHRYVRELEDHVVDLLREAGTEEAALARLGRDEDLAQALLACPQFRSWTGRLPWAILLVGPSLLLLAGYLLAGLVLAAGYLAGYGSFMGLDRFMALPPLWMIGLAKSVGAFSAYVLPLLLGWSIAFAALRQRSDRLWPATGIAVVSCVGAGLIGFLHAGCYISFHIPASPDTWHAVFRHFSVDLVWLPRIPASVPLMWFAGSWMANLALTMLPYGLLRVHLLKPLARGDR